MVAALRSVADADRGPRLRRRGPGFEASPIRIPIRLEKYSGENLQWNIVKNRMAVRKLLRPFAVCNIVKNLLVRKNILSFRLASLDICFAASNIRSCKS